MISDPGIAVLENLTAFQALQRSSLYQVSDQAMEMLCSLVALQEKGPGGQSLAGRMRKEGPDRLLPGQKLYAGGLCFETEQEEDTKGSALTGVFLETGGSCRIWGCVCRKRLPAVSFCLEAGPQTGDCLLFYDGTAVPVRESGLPFG